MTDAALLKMHELLIHAAPNGNSPPGVLLLSPENTLVWVYIASKGATNPGKVTAVEYGSKPRRLFGFILPDGSWEPGRGWNNDGTDVLTPVREFIADPANVAASQGAETGKCAFCAGSNLGDPPYFHVACARRFGLGELPAV